MNVGSKVRATNSTVTKPKNLSLFYYTCSEILSPNMNGLFSLPPPTDRDPQFQFRPLSTLHHDMNSGDRLNLIPEDEEYDEDACYVFMRGPRYNAYALLRESHLLKKHRERERREEIGRIDALVTAVQTRKQVRFQESVKDVKVFNFMEPGRVGGRKVSSVVAQSVPDFSAVLRKENRRPPVEITLTPPSKKKGSPGMGSGWSAKGSRSAGAAEKRAGGAAARKSYASLEELRGSTVRAANAICGGTGDGKRRILGSRRF